jgi:signal transduction histidine kinase
MALRYLMKYRINELGLAYKLILYIFLSVAIIFAGIFWYNYEISGGIVAKNLRHHAENLTIATVLKVDKVLSTLQKIPDNYVRIVEAYDFDDDDYLVLLKQMMETNPEIYGTALAFEPYFFHDTIKYYSPYFYREGDTIAYKNIGNSEYDYFTMDWYQIPKELGEPVWSEPYYDEGAGNVVMTTYSVPMYKTMDGAKTLIGILTIDVSLDWLRDVIGTVKVYETGYAFMISGIGTMITHPNKDLILNETLFSISDAQESPKLREIARNMIHGKTSFAEFEYRNLITGELSWISYAPVPINNWSVGIVFPVDELMADVNNLYLNLIALVLGGLVFILIVIVVISRSITKPLRGLTQAASRFALGDFDVPLPRIRSKDEIGRLNASFIYMQETLANTLSELREASANLQISNEKLEEYNRTLEQKVEARTAELKEKHKELDASFNELKAAQTQLVQSEKMASLGQLTAGIAHEIKNPLNFVNNFAELTIDLAKELGEEIESMAGNLSEKDVSYLKEIIGDLSMNAKRIHDHGKRADSIVKGMLLHSRGQTGEKQPTDINAVLAEYVNLGYHGMRAQDSGFNIKLISDYDPAIGMVNVVPQNLSRVFLNIINNACYATHEKKLQQKEAYFPELSVSTKNSPDHIEIRIRDNGKGIPQAVLDKVFNPFFTTKPPGQGTGLGLSLSYDIVVQEHRGSLVVDSKEGEYAEFIITIPKNL